MATGKELATFDAASYEVLAPGSETAELMQEVLAENLGGGNAQAFDLDRITVPSGGGIAWELQTLDGPQTTQDLQGVIVSWSTPRAYWEKALEDSDEGGTPPDCFSDDGTVGIGVFGQGSEENPSGQCAGCPMDQWGSDPGGNGKGKACKESRMLFVLLPERTLPVLLHLAPTSIQPLKQYMLRLAGQGIPYYSVVTSFKLQKVEDGKFKYSVVQPSLVSRLDTDTRKAAKEYGQRVVQAFAVQRDTGAEVATAVRGSGPVDGGPPPEEPPTES